ncbi:MAG: hypothetical protein OEV68_16750, partial [candidate division Zixibacteria bacterium]|nr:hypothetical protein [candidate division Zixibacteria bacterium]
SDYDDDRTIDWPTLYYLNDEYGCRVDLVTLKPHTQFHTATTSLPRREIYMHRYLVPDDSGAMLMVEDSLFKQRRPDLIIFGPSIESVPGRAFKSHVTALPESDSLLFNVIKIFQLIADDRDRTDPANTVVINVREASRRYRGRMDREIPQLTNSYYTDEIGVGILSHYRILVSRLGVAANKSDFLSGIETNRLKSVIDDLTTAGPRATILQDQAKRFQADFEAARRAEGRERVDLLVSGYDAVLNLQEAALSAPADPLKLALTRFLKRTLYRAERATLDAVGIDWEGRITLRESPHGLKAKVVLALSVDGPSEVDLTAVQFLPAADTARVTLDSVPRTIVPHQSYVRQYLVDIETDQLETTEPDSLTFVTILKYGRTPLVLSHSLPLKELPNLKVRFDPEFFFVPPVAQLDVDRIVASMAWNIVITKPPDLTGDVHIKLASPRGVFAGAYRTDLSLEEGTVRRMVRIPFSVSNLLEQGIHFPTVSLVVDGQVVAADTGRMRIAACKLNSEPTVTFLPDSTGLLEDCLGMTSAATRPMTSRSLMTADLSAYDVLLIGSGAAQRFDMLSDARDRLEDYVRRGGSVVTFGQDYRWPHDVLPFMLVPSLEQVPGSDIAVVLPDAKILTQPYQISVGNLFKGFGSTRKLAAAVVSPSEKVLTTPSGAVLLSVSRLGDGQVIYCGLPLFEMIGDLNLQAIHLLANILNY